MEEKTYLQECAEELDNLLENGVTDYDALFDACGDLDPFEVLDMIM